MIPVEERRQDLPHLEMLHPEAELVTIEFLRGLPDLVPVENVGNCGRTLHMWTGHTYVGTEEAFVYVGLDVNRQKAQITIQKGEEFGDREEWVVSNDQPDHASYDLWFFLGRRLAPVSTLFSTDQVISCSYPNVKLPLWRIRYKNQGQQEPEVTLKKIGDIDTKSCDTQKGSTLTDFARVNQRLREALKHPVSSVPFPQTEEGKPDTSFFPFSY